MTGAQNCRLASFFFALGLFGLSSLALGIEPPKVPDSLRVPPEQVVLLKAQGTGAQIYACKADAGHFAWTLKAPDAMLTNDKRQKVARHYAGPTWEATDGSKVVGEPIAHADSPQPDAVPWLLLRAKSTEGNGTFSNVTYIQRLSTQGGKAPAGGCDSAHAGAETNVHYQATYYFYGMAD